MHVDDDAREFVGPEDRTRARGAIEGGSKQAELPVGYARVGPYCRVRNPYR